MHCELRKCGQRPDYADRLWFFRYGFGLWLGGLIFTIGHDTRPRGASIS